MILDFVHADERFAELFAALRKVPFDDSPGVREIPVILVSVVTDEDVPVVRDRCNGFMLRETGNAAPVKVSDLLAAALISGTKNKR